MLQAVNLTSSNQLLIKITIIHMYIIYSTCSPFHSTKESLAIQKQISTKVVIKTL